ncbi:hypothetical protein OH807_31065 [Kitasatospora sp. NBC_01560]|uniref:hypothetical protein n=1 Tax=Kitasatospora sp. NBC_01560 TaxID=2975965 RepID=UPI00386343EA
MDSLRTGVVLAGDSDRILDDLPAEWKQATVRTATNQDLPQAIAQATAEHLLVAPDSRCRNEDLHRISLAAATAGKQIGFLATWGGERTVAAQLEKLTTYAHVPVPGTMAFSQFGFSGVTPGGSEDFLIRADDDPSLLPELGKGHRVVGMATHGNGLDARLTGMVLCPLADQRVVDQAGRAAPCGNGGPCIRGKRQDGVLVEPPTIGPHGITAETLVWQTCFGMPAAGWVYEPEHALAQGFLRGRGVRNLLTTYRVVETDDSLLLYALALIESNHCLGDVVLSLNRAAVRHSEAAPWLLLGDPAWRLDPSRDADPPVAADPSPVQLKVPAASISLIPHRRHLDEPDSVVDAPDGITEPGTLLIDTVPGADHAVVLNTGSTERRLTVRRPDERPISSPGAVVRSVWSSTDGLAGSLRLLALGLQDPAIAPTVPDGLVAEVVGELQYHAVALAALSRGEPLLNGVRTDVVELAAAESARWSALHRSLLDFLNTYCETFGSGIGYLYHREAVTAGQGELPGRCHYCGSRLSYSDIELVLAHHNRRRVECDGCGPVRDTSAAVRDLYLEGPDDCRQGETVRYRLRGSLQAPMTGFSQLAARVTFDHLPWDMGPGSEIAELLLRPGCETFPELEFEVPIPPDAPGGVYFLSAPITFQGEMWTLKRPVTVIRSRPDHDS